MPPSSLTYSLTPDDLAAFNRFVAASTKQGQLIRVTIAGFIAAAGPGLVGPRPLAFAFSLLAALAFYLRYPAFAARHARSRALQSAAQPNGAGLVCEHTLTLTPEGITEVTALSQNHTAWSLVRTVAETPSHTYIFVSENMAHVIPNSRISQQDLSAFVTYAKERVANSAAPINPTPIPG